MELTMKKIMKLNIKSVIESFFLTKNLIKKTTFKLTFCIFSCLLIFSQNLEKEVAALKKEYEKIQSQYWKKKDAQLKETEKIKDETQLLDEKLRFNYKIKNDKAEELYINKETVRSDEEKYQDLLEKRSVFIAKLKEDVLTEQKNLKKKYPYLLNKGISKLNTILKELDKENLSLQRVSKKIIDYKKDLILQGEQILIDRKKILTPNGAKNVNLLRIGFVHSSYITKEGNVGVLIKDSNIKGSFYEWVAQDLPSNLKKRLANGVKKSFIQYDKETTTLPIPVDVAQAGRKTVDLLQGVSKGFIAVIIKFFQDGGIIMYPLALLCLFAAFIIQDRIRFFKRINKKRREEVEKVAQLLQSEDYETAKQKISSSQKSHEDAFYKLYMPFLQDKLDQKDKLKEDEEIEKHIEDVFSRETPKLEKYLSTLAILGAVAPLLGLLGTVTGMIELFDVITLFGTSNPKVLAGGISVALVTTQAGLAIAIPIMLTHHFLVKKKNFIVESLQKYSLTLFNQK